MILRILAVSAFFSAALSLPAQTRPVSLAAQSAKTAPAIDAHDYAVTKVKLAIANAQLASAKAQPLDQEAQHMVQEAQALISSTQKQLGLDDTWQWDFAASDYVKKPQPQPTHPAPAANAPKVSQPAAK